MVDIDAQAQAFGRGTAHLTPQIRARFEARNAMSLRKSTPALEDCDASGV
jgi:hypothetical protein